MYVVLEVTLPPSKDRAIYEKMKEQMSFDPRAGMGV